MKLIKQHRLADIHFLTHPTPNSSQLFTVTLLLDLENTRKCFFAQTSIPLLIDIHEKI